MNAQEIVALPSARPVNGRGAGWALLLIGGAFMGVTNVSMTLQGDDTSSQWVALLVWCVCAIMGEWWLWYRLPKHDPLMFPLVLVMTGWGLITIHRLLPTFGERQTLWLVVATLTLCVVIALPKLFQWLRNYRYLLLIFGLFLLLGTILFGTNPSGAEGAPQLWLGIGNLYFQPSELLKIILVAFLASYLAEQYSAFRAGNLFSENRRWNISPRILGPMLLMWGLSVIILIWQRDLGTAILFFVLFVTLVYVASGYTILLWAGVLLVLAAGVVAYRLFDVVQLRIDIWLNPWLEADGRAYQIVQSLMAFAAGGTFGEGIGQGYAAYIPVIHSDFIFAAIAEEWGLIGITGVIALLATLVMRGLYTASLQRGRPFQTLLAVGLSLLIGIQSLMIMGGVLKLIPLTGVTLPFFSYGGSSLVMNFIIVGMLLRLSAENG
jgi:cell division protein FtsW